MIVSRTFVDYWNGGTTAIQVTSSPGVAAGLVLGKLNGIAGFSWVTVRLGISELLKGLNFNHIIGVASMSGIGLTM